MRTRTLMFVAAALLTAICTTHAGASIVQYTVDPTQSLLSIVGGSVYVDAYGQRPITEQAAGSLTASYSGTIDADVTASTIQILSATNLIAGNSGNWNPDGVTPANYGLTGILFTTVNGATRGLELQLSDSAAKPLTAGTFDEAGTTAAFTAGTTTYTVLVDSTDMTTISAVLTQDAAGTGTLSTSGGVETLIIPVSFTVTYTTSGADFTVPLSGTIVATRAFHAVPELTSLAVWGLLGGLALTTFRGRRSGGKEMGASL